VRHTAACGTHSSADQGSDQTPTGGLLHWRHGHDVRIADHVRQNVGERAPKSDAHRILDPALAVDVDLYSRAVTSASDT